MFLLLLMNGKFISFTTRVAQHFLEIDPVHQVALAKETPAKRKPKDVDKSREESLIDDTRVI